MSAGASSGVSSSVRVNSIDEQIKKRMIETETNPVINSVFNPTGDIVASNYSNNDDLSTNGFQA